MKEKIIKILLYVLLFSYFFVGIQFIYNEFNCDQIYQFGFSYALIKGEIPYLDYNMIVTPFSTIIYAIPLIFKILYLLLNLFQALLLTLFFAFLFKKYNKQGYILLSIFSLFYPLQFVKIWYAGYSFLLIVEFVFLMYLEDKNDKGYITGILLSLVLLTKQTIGLPLILINIYYFIKDREKFFNILKTYFILPCIFFIYLLISGSLFSFVDQCFLGLFDFASSNSAISIWFWLFLIESCFILFKFFNTKDIKYLYLLLYSGVTLPSFDQYHFAIYEFLFIFVLLKNIDIKLTNKYLLLFSSFILVAMFSLYYGMFYHFNIKKYTHSYNHFEYLVENKVENKTNILISDYIKKYKNKRIIILHVF